MKLREAIQLWFGSKSERRRMAARILRKRASRLGLYVYSEQMVWKEQPFFARAKIAASEVKGIPDPRCFVLQSALRSVSSIEGAVAECGVRQGRSTLFMLAAEEGERTYHLFDSFAGLSNPTGEDRTADGRTLWEEGDLSTDEAVARKNLEGFANVRFHVGWIPQTLSAVADERFAFVHIDVDLYEPTKGALEFFWDRLQPNGLVVCDDYGSANCPGARKAFDEFYRDRPEAIIELPTGQALVAKRG